MNHDPNAAEAVRRACIQAGEAAYEDAGFQGLCAEGRWEAAVSAMRRVDVAAAARNAAGAAESDPSTLPDHNRPTGDRNGAGGVSGAHVVPDRP